METACKTGLPDERKLGLSEEKDFPITVAAWTREIQKKLEDCGMDTVFLIYDPTKAVQERSLFSDWGNVTRAELRTWIQDLTTDGVKTGEAGREAVCQWDVDNLEWSGDLIKNSVSFKLWREIEGLKPGTTGPQLMKAALDRLQNTSTSTARSLVNQLETLKLSKEPGMDVPVFITKVTPILEQINQCDERSIPSDLSAVMAACFLDTGVAAFNLEATTLFNQLDRDPTVKTPTEVLEQMRDKYIGLEGKKMWPHKSQKQKQDELSAMKATMNTLQQKVDNFGKKPAAGGSGGGKNNNNQNGKKQPDHSDRTCFKCGKKGHIRPNCPEKEKTNNRAGSGGGGSPNGNSSPIQEWMLKPPGQGESEVKMHNGIEYKWCSKCKLGKDKKPMWRSGVKRHVTSECWSKQGQSQTNALASIQEE